MRAAAKSGRLAIRAGSGRAATCGVFAPLVTQVGYISRQGDELLLAGRPLREVSFDRFDLLMQYVVTEQGMWEHDVASGPVAAEKALGDLQRHGYAVVRVMTSPFYPSWFVDAFLDPDPAR